MINRYHFKTRCLSIWACLMTLLILHPLNIFAEQGQANIDRIVKVKDGLVSVTAEDEATFNILKETEVSDVLKKIEKETGVKMTIGNGLAGKKIETDFVDIEIESALRRLLNGTYYVLHYDQDPKNKDKRILKEVKAATEEIGSKQFKGRVVSKDVPYGNEKGSVGLITGEEIPRMGPESFTNDAEGNIYICDTINRRILIYSSDGNYLEEIPLGEVVPKDIAVDKSGYIYIYDGKLRQFDRKGTLLKTIKVDGNRIRIALHIVDDKIFISSVDQVDVQIGRIENGLLLAPPQVDISKTIKTGFYGFSGNRYFVRMKRWENGEIDIIDKNSVVIKTIFLPIKGIVGIAFLQEDKDGNIYFEMSRTENEKLVVEIQKFDSEGNYLTTIQFSEIGSWASKGFSLDDNGNIYQFIPRKDAGKINIFKENK